MDAEEFRKAGKQMVDFIADYMTNIRDRPVLPDVRPGYINELVPADPPEDGESWDKIFSDIERVIMPGMTHWHSPHFHAYFPTAQSYPATLADMLSSTLACIGFSWIASPACTELEMVMMDWLGKMLNLPEQFLFSTPGGHGGGVIQSTASESTLMAILAAKAKAVSKIIKKDPTMNPKDIREKLVVYVSQQAHSSVERAALLVSVRCHLLSTDDNYSLRGPTLRKVIQEDKILGYIPMAVVATLGTTNSCAFDNLLEIGPICEIEGMWLHIDAAYAGSSFLCPEFRHYLDGIEYASSFNMNPHKWMLITFDCSAMWLRHREDVENAFKVNPVYLQHDHQGGKVPDYRHWHIPLGRRFRSLKMWFVFRSYGIKGLQAYIRMNVSLAKEFEKCVQSDDRFEVVTPTVLGLVCFRYKGTDEINRTINDFVNERKKIHITPTNLKGLFVLRFAICSKFTESKDITFAWKEIVEATEIVLKKTNRTEEGEGKMSVKGHEDLVRRVTLPGEIDYQTR